MSAYVKACHEAGKECMLALPAIFRQEARDFFEKNLESLKRSGLDAVVVKNLDEIGFLRASGWKIPMVADHNLYSWNRKARSFLREQGFVRDTLPPGAECGRAEERGCAESEMVAYGYLPLMVTAGCIHKTVEGCDRKRCAARSSTATERNFR